jgi:hypothetical protein
MNDHFRDLPSFRMRLSETAAWCMRHSIESNPVESIEARERRKVGAKAGEFAKKSVQASGPKFWKSYLLRRALRLYAKAKLYELLPLAKQLRSPILQPAPFEPRQSPAVRTQIVETLADKRAEQLRIEQCYPSTPLPDLGGGRLLLYAPDENLCDGAAQSSSKGFFDVDNLPPWDTWVCFVDRYLVSWVPPQLLDLANQGVDVNPEQCILWTSDTDLPYA